MKKTEQGKVKYERMLDAFVGHDEENLILTHLTCGDSPQLRCFTLVKVPVTGQSNRVQEQHQQRMLIVSYSQMQPHCNPSKMHF